MLQSNGRIYEALTRLAAYYIRAGEAGESLPMGSLSTNAVLLQHIHQHELAKAEPQGAKV